jgi:hypothetical protein
MTCRACEQQIVVLPELELHVKFCTAYKIARCYVCFQTYDTITRAYECVQNHVVSLQRNILTLEHILTKYYVVTNVKYSFIRNIYLYFRMNQNSNVQSVTQFLRISIIITPIPTYVDQNLHSNH